MTPPDSSHVYRKGDPGGRSVHLDRDRDRRGELVEDRRRARPQDPPGYQGGDLRRTWRRSRFRRVLPRDWAGYVSCSPYRVPIARLAAAQAALARPSPARREPQKTTAPVVDTNSKGLPVPEAISVWNALLTTSLREGAMGWRTTRLPSLQRTTYPEFLTSRSTTCASNGGRFPFRSPASGSRRQLPICRLSWRIAKGVLLATSFQLRSSHKPTIPSFKRCFAPIPAPRARTIMDPSVYLRVNAERGLAGAMFPGPSHAVAAREGFTFISARQRGVAEGSHQNGLQKVANSRRTGSLMLS